MLGEEVSSGAHAAREQDSHLAPHIVETGSPSRSILSFHHGTYEVVSGLFGPLRYQLRKELGHSRGVLGLAPLERVVAPRQTRCFGLRPCPDQRLMLIGDIHQLTNQARRKRNSELLDELDPPGVDERIDELVYQLVDHGLEAPQPAGLDRNSGELTLSGGASGGSHSAIVVESAVGS